MGKMCMDCMEEYKNDEIMSPFKTSEVGLYQECPKRACVGKIYAIDDNLLSTIMILNNKGYTTHSSCAGHHLEELTECYIEFAEHVTSLPELPSGFKFRMKTVDGKKRLSVYCKPKSEDPTVQFSELLEFADILYDWACGLEFNFHNLSDIDFAFVDFDSPIASLFGLFDELREPEKKPKEKKKLDVDKLKESAPKGSIKFKKTDAEEGAEPPKEEEETEAPKKKRGRPKKNQE